MLREVSLSLCMKLINYEVIFYYMLNLLFGENFNIIINIRMAKLILF